MKTEKEFIDQLSILRKEFANRNVTSQDYGLDGWIIRAKYIMLEWALEKRYCLICGKSHTNRLMACSEECSKKLYG